MYTEVGFHLKSGFKKVLCTPICPPLGFGTQYFIRLKSGFGSDGNRQHFYVLVLRVRIAEYVFYLINRPVVAGAVLHTAS